MKPIIFNSEMIRAIIEGRKTIARRPLKQQPDACCYEPVLNENGIWEFCADVFPEELKNYKYKCPYGKVGDKLWVRETFTIETNWTTDSNEGYPPPFKDGRPINWKNGNGDFEDYWEQCHYCATDPEPELACFSDKCRQCDENGGGSHWKPSIHMPRWASRITLEITDVRVERVHEITGKEVLLEGVGKDCVYPRRVFEVLWNKIYGLNDWNSNPWVWVIEFKRKEKK